MSTISINGKGASRKRGALTLAGPSDGQQARTGFNKIRGGGQSTTSLGRGGMSRSNGRGAMSTTGISRGGREEQANRGFKSGGDAQQRFQSVHTWDKLQPIHESV